MTRTPASTRGSAHRGPHERFLRGATVALLTAALAGVPAAAATAGPDTSTAAGTTAPSTSSPLSWEPPELTAPRTVAVSATNRNLKLTAGQDYIITMPATPLVGLHGLQIHGGRNIVLVGGEIELPAAAITSSTHAGRGLYIHGQTGTVHVEGLRLTGDGLEDGINIDARDAVVQLQNIRVDLAHGSRDAHHADVLQTWGGPRVLRIDGLTGYTQYQGLFLLPTQYGATEPILADIRRTDLHAVGPDSGYLMWRDGLSWPLDVTEVYVEPRLPLSRDSFLWPKGTAPGTSAWPSVHVGTPPAGEFVTTSDAGLGYVSPGYGATLADLAEAAGHVAVVRPPVGALEAVTAVRGGLRVSGWAADGDTTEPLLVDVTVAGTDHRVVASGPRADVPESTPGLSRTIGFDTTVPLPVGTHEVCVTALNVGSGTDTPLGCLPGTVADTTAPTVTGPALSLRTGTVSVDGVVPVTATWAATDDVAVTGTRLTSPVLAEHATGVLSAPHEVGLGTSTWTVDATDAAGNTGTASSDIAVALTADGDASRYNYWWRRDGGGFLGGTALCTNRGGASMSHTFTGRGVAWVASKESTGGLADVYVDGVKEATVDLGASVAAHRSVVFTRDWDTAGSHTITVVVLGGGRVTSDGFVTTG